MTALRPPPFSIVDPSPPISGFWQRRVRTPLITLFTQGLTPDKIAQTLAVCFAISMFPLLGTTTVLNLAIGTWLRMNQPLMQTLNYVLAPLHLVMIVIYVRIGEWIWRVQDDFTLPEMLRAFHDETFLRFLHRFGWAAIHAISAWALTAPLFIGLVYFATRPALRRLARRSGSPS